MRVGIVDYGCGNMFSLKSSFARLGALVEAVSDERGMAKCDRLVLPGVGAFGDAAEKLHKSGADAAVAAAAKSTPLLGICLGMQLLFEKSTEYGEHKGLGLLDGIITPLKGYVQNVKIPHMGWNSLVKLRKSKLLKYTDDGTYVYFVHSYHATEARCVVATADYGGAVTAAAERGHIFGTQFHPEKSGENGLKILQAFLEQ